MYKLACFFLWLVSEEHAHTHPHSPTHTHTYTHVSISGVHTGISKHGTPLFRCQMHRWSVQANTCTHEQNTKSNFLIWTTNTLRWSRDWEDLAPNHREATLPLLIISLALFAFLCIWHRDAELIIYACRYREIKSAAESEAGQRHCCFP